jgi:hypothetical protein
MKIDRAVISKFTILFSGVHLNGPYFWSWNVHINWALTHDG